MLQILGKGEYTHKKPVMGPWLQDTPYSDHCRGVILIHIWQNLCTGEAMWINTGEVSMLQESAHTQNERDFKTSVVVSSQDSLWPKLKIRSYDKRIFKGPDPFSQSKGKKIHLE